MPLPQRVRIYELVTLVNPDFTDEQLNSLMEEIHGLIAQNQGELLRSQIWGRRKLAYEVKGRRNGAFLVFYYKGTGALNKDLTYRLQIHENVLKHMVVHIEDEFWADFPAPPDIFSEPEPRQSREDGDGEGRRRHHFDDGEERFAEDVED